MTPSPLRDTMEIPQSFIHKPPNGYEYEAVRQKANLISIWTVYRSGFTYNNHSPSRCIWGFYNTKKQQYHSPINAKRVGAVVDVKDTTPYTAMKLNLNPLEYALYSSS